MACSPRIAGKFLTDRRPAWLAARLCTRLCALSALKQFHLRDGCRQRNLYFVHDRLSFAGLRKAPELSEANPIKKSNISFEHSFPASSVPNALHEDEIDLIEIGRGLWSQKSLIAAVTLVCLSLSVLYALRAMPVYKSSAVFHLSSGESRPRLPSELGGLANLAGLDLGDGGAEQGVFDRLQGREFILGVAEALHLDNDPYFNPYGGGTKDPSGLARLAGGLKAIVAPASPQDSAPGADRLAEDAIVERFRTAVVTSETKNGSIRIDASHEDPERAAALVNTSMNRLLTALEQERRDAQSKQLAYLSEQLADALIAMNTAHERIQDFALENSLVSTGVFAEGSQLMFRLREELETSQEMQAATAELLKLADSGASLDQQDYIALRRDFPIVDDLDFRRLLDVPAGIDQWSWPKKERLVEFQNILSGRVLRTRRELEKMQAEAEEYVEATDRLTALKREASIAEATYELLIEQMKSQAFAAGFRSDIAKIYQTAVPATRPYEPQRPMIAALGAVLGLLIGSGLAVARNFRHGWLHSGDVIREVAGAELSATAELRTLKAGKPQALLEAAEALRAPGLAALAVDLNEKSTGGVFCVSAGSRTPAAGPAMWIAGHLARQGHRVAFLDLSGETEAPEGAAADDPDGPWRAIPIGGRVDFVTPAAAGDGGDLLLRNGFPDDLRRLMTGYDRVIVSAASCDAVLAQRVLHRLSLYTVAVCGSGLARRALLSDLREIAAFDACLIEA